MSRNHHLSHLRHAQAAEELVTLSLYLSIVLLTVLVGFGGGGTRSEEVALLWGTAVGLGLAHFFAFRMTRNFAEGRTLPTREDGWVALGVAAAIVITCGLSTIPYLLVPDTLEASTAASVLLLGMIGLTGYASVHRQGGSVQQAVIGALVAGLIAAVVVMIKYTLAH